MSLCRRNDPFAVLTPTRPGISVHNANAIFGPPVSLSEPHVRAMARLACALQLTRRAARYRRLHGPRVPAHRGLLLMLLLRAPSMQLKLQDGVTWQHRDVALLRTLSLETRVTSSLL
jgi:hypothetical protein